MEGQRQRWATAIGMLAIALWSTSVGITRSTTEALGPTAAPALLFTLSALLQWPRRSPLVDVPRPYLWLGALLFVGYQVCFVLSLALARSRAEAIEVGMVNYLWPSLTVLCSALAGGTRPNAAMIAGLGLAFAGIVAAAAPAEGVSWTRFFHNAGANPVSYGLAFAAAFLWALYSTCTRYLARGRSALWFYLACSAGTFWALHLLQGAPLPTHFSPGLLALVALAGASVTLAYGCWNHGLLHGRIQVLALAANATPLLAALFASLLLRTPLPAGFWLGAAMVVAGSALAARGARASV